MADSYTGETTQKQSSLIPFLPQNHSMSVKLSDANFLMWKQQVLATVRGGMVLLSSTYINDWLGIMV